MPYLTWRETHSFAREKNRFRKTFHHMGMQMSLENSEMNTLIYIPRYSSTDIFPSLSVSKMSKLSWQGEKKIENVKLFEFDDVFHDLIDSFPQHLYESRDTYLNEVRSHPFGLLGMEEKWQFFTGQYFIVVCVSKIKSLLFTWDQYLEFPKTFLFEAFNRYNEDLFKSMWVEFGTSGTRPV